MATSRKPRALPHLVGVFLTVAMIAGCTLFSFPDVPLNTSTDAERDAGSDIQTDRGDLSRDTDASLDIARDMTPASSCGDQTIDEGEDCELDQTIACTELGFVGGEAVCAQNCVWDTANCTGCDLYIDSTGGDDAASGTAEGEAWQTLTNLRTFLAGASAQEQTVVCLRRGTSYSVTEPLNLNWVGSSTTRLLIRDYGPEPDAPILTGRTPAQFTLKDAANNIWNAPYPDHYLTLNSMGWVILDDDRLIVFGVDEYEISPQMDGTIDYHLPDGMTPGETFFLSITGVSIDPDVDPARYIEVRRVAFDAFFNAVRINAESSDISNITFDSNRILNSRFAWFVDEAENRAMLRINIQRNTIENVASGFFSQFDGGGTFSRDVLISENTVFGGATNASSAIQVNAIGSRIQGNRIEAFDGRAIRTLSNGVVDQIEIVGNFISGVDQGIVDGTTSEISNNIIVDADVAMSLFSGAGRLIAHNTTYNVNTVIQLWSMASGTMNNNYFHAGGTHIFINDGTSSITSNHNVFSPNATISDQGTTRDLASWRSLTGNDTDSFEEAPMFVTMPPVEPEDFQIAQGSAASNNGTTTDADADFEGNARDKTAPDIGAWERP